MPSHGEPLAAYRIIANGDRWLSAPNFQNAATSPCFPYRCLMDTLTHTMPNYVSMSFEELTAHKKELDAAYQSKKAEAYTAFLARVQAEAASLGFDLGMVGNGKAAKARGKVAGGQSEAPVLYRHPETGEGWSGRGKPKKWAQAIIEQDITAEKGTDDYAVQLAAAVARFKEAYKAT